MTATAIVILAALVAVGGLVAWVCSLTWEIHDLELKLAHEERKVATLKSERASLERALAVRNASRR